MARIQLGYILPTEGRDQQRRSTLVQEMNRALDLIAGHFDSVWAIDHLQFGDSDVLEGFTTLAYLSALHPQFKFGNTVLCQSFRNPALLGKMGATLQFLTGGRFILGIGAGWHAEEYSAYGYEFPPAEVRVDQLNEAVQIIKRMWSEENVTFDGQYYRVKEAYCQPKPDPIPPILIGARKPKMLRLAARHADWWDVSSTGPTKYCAMADRFERACMDIGRDPSTIRRSWSGGCACAPTEKEAADLTGGRWNPDDEEDFNLVGTPDQVVEQMKPFIDLGVDYFMVGGFGSSDEITLQMLVHEVLPRLANL